MTLRLDVASSAGLRRYCREAKVGRSASVRELLTAWGESAGVRRAVEAWRSERRGEGKMWFGKPVKPAKKERGA